MNIEQTNFEGLYVIEPKVIEDKRGWFMRTYDENIFYNSLPNFKSNWVQMNHSFNKEKFTWRGFHFQVPPHQETKVIRCVSGAIKDYVIDIRKNSSTFLQVYSIDLTATNKKMLFIPKGFAHGFMTLKENSEVLYLHDEFYKPNYEGGIRYNDERLNFKIKNEIAHISERDLRHKLLTKEFKGY